MKAYIKHGYMTKGPFRDEEVESRSRYPDYGRRPNQMGYGTDLACGWQVKFDGRWYNCLVMCYGNGAGTPYIKVRGERLYVGNLG